MTHTERKRMQLLAIDTVGGIPAHPLLVHIPVLMIPLALALTILAFHKPARTPALWGAAGSAFVGLIGCFLASSSGEALQNAVENDALLRAHTEAGDQVALFAAPFFVVLLVALVVQLSRNDALPFVKSLSVAKKVSATVLTGVLALSVALGALASYKTYQAGHSGAKSAWHDVDVSKVHEGDHRGGGD